MFFAIITLVTALIIAGIAGWFSIVGLMSIFSAQALSTAIMAGALEVGKLVSASWLYRNWHTASWFIKSYLIVAVLVLMLITSMGIFGFLSKAHLQHTGVASEVALQIERIDAKMSREKQKITDAETVIGQLDETVQVLMNNERIRGADGALAVRRSQTEERASLNAEIDQASATLASLQDQRLELSQKTLAVEQELGPLKYVAELIYTEQNQENLDRAVRIFILLLVSVFDPLAVILLIAANNSLMRHGLVLEKPAEPMPVAEPLAESQSEPLNCYKCGATLSHAPGIGPFCPEKQCDVFDSPLASDPEPQTPEPLVTEPMPEPEPQAQEITQSDPDLDIKTEPATITDTEVQEDRTDSSEKTPDTEIEQLNIPEVIEEVPGDLTEENVEPEIREMVEELIQEETPDLSQLQQVAKHLANSRANKSQMTEEEIVEVLASSTQESAARKKLGFWAVKLPDKDV